MNFKEVRRLVKLVEKSDISSLEIDEDGSLIKIEKKFGDGVQVQQVHGTPIPTPIASVHSDPIVQATSNDEVRVDTEVSTDNFHEVTAPMVGTFYSSSNPDVWRRPRARGPVR